jgi:hypothetical protein
MEFTGYDLVGYWIAAFLTFCVFSFLYKDNPFYKFAEHLFVGISAGYGVVMQYYDVLLPNLIQPLGNFRELGGWWFVYLAGAILSLMMFARFSRSAGWMARWPLAFVVGVFTGASIIGYAVGDLVIQVQASIEPFGEIREAMDTGVTGPPIWWSVTNTLLLTVGVCTALLYFFFSTPQKGAIGWASRVGIYFMMVSFGFSFGYTVMGRIALAIGRAQEMLIETPQTPTAPWPAIVSLLVVGGGLVVLERMGRLKSPEEEEEA